ncbi:LysM peptidoglycan-binding domain-containing protein [Xanthomonas oryzae]|uniref:LysM peptidoglycan-binding domain-containing protein n=1 Tax=Xanthomonas oryzae TaxID=347 RepID=UPI00215B842A|nr:LysM domain-containing protein [Xanthomonas oryzae]
MNDLALYKIKSGDSLDSIARQHGTSVEEISKLNNIKNPNIIRTGQQLKMPNKKAWSLASQETKPQSPPPTSVQFVF